MPYSASLAAFGGNTPYSWSSSGLPEDLSVGATGVISGTPQQAGVFTPTIAVTDANGGTVTRSFSLAVAKATPVVAWSNPAGIVYGTPLSAAQLNATADVAGTFSYTPAAGTILNAGSQTLSVSFTPNDTGRLL